MILKKGGKGGEEGSGWLVCVFIPLSGCHNEFVPM